MLQKLIVVVVGLVMSVVGALSPEALFASNDAGGGSSLAANTAEEMLSTLRTSDGQAFARVSVLWVEVDGQRVTEDAWGTGELEEIRFKVGVKDVDSVALAVGEKVVDLHPTDIITVRMFRGDFSYRGLGTPLATVQLQGTVKTTVLKEGDVTNRVLTQRGGLDLENVRDTQPGDDTKVAYVVLTTGEKVDTVAVEDGGARLYTEDAATASEAKNEPGNLLASWVKIDNKLVREYTWGDGLIKKIEFEPAQAATRSVVLAFNGEVAEVSAGERVVVEDFVGEYLVYQVSGGLMRIRLDGYAAVFDTNAVVPLPVIGGEGAPNVDFDFLPLSPKSTDTVQFTDKSSDDGGRIVFWRWDFGDNTSAILETPTHRYAKPGTYEVTLSVTDNDLQTSTVSQSIVVRNTEPVSDFDFSPKVVTTDTVVAFNDESFDPDGQVLSRFWDFGDGNTSTEPHPTHRFARGGDITVTLRTTDNLGGQSSLSKIVIVRNDPPTAGFTFEPASPVSKQVVNFTSLAADTDGTIQTWNWSFGDGRFGSGSNPTHFYERPGLYTITLTAFDDSGDSDTVSSSILVRNRLPAPEFNWTPGDQPANVPVRFTSSSTDEDGRIMLYRWDFGDGSLPAVGASVSHVFPRAGRYNVTLSVTDDTLGTSEVVHQVGVSNSMPLAKFATTPNPAFRYSDVVFSDESTDPDGDPIVAWLWNFGDGSDPVSGRVVSHQFTTVGPKAVTLTVTDATGSVGTSTYTVRVLNRAPTALIDLMPGSPVTGQSIEFTARAADLDGAEEALRYEWRFSDGSSNDTKVARRAFNTPGNYTVTLRVYDADGGVSPPARMTLNIQPARPNVGFSWSPEVPLRGETVQFRDDTIPAPNAAIREWRWVFSPDPGANSPLPSPTFTYTKNGTFLVSLTVEDVNGQTNTMVRPVHINLAPTARFAVTDDTLERFQPVSFTDTSFDNDNGHITNWTWSFGDGRVDYTRHPTLPQGFPLPGVYSVNLTVTDNNGSSDVETRFISVANQAPVASWTHTTNNAPQERGVPFKFNSSTSYDPDGQPIAGWSWDLGDRTTSTAPDPEHAYAASGPKTVSLAVSDGLVTSSRSTQTISVLPNHAVRIHLRAMLTGDRTADLSNPSYTIGVLQGTGSFTGATIAREGTDVNITIPKERWFHDLELNVRIDAPFLSQSVQQPVRFKDGVEVIDLVLPLRLNMLATIRPQAGDNPTIIPQVVQDLIGGANNVSGDPIYRDMRERPHGVGTLRYSDGTVASFQDVTIEARWVPMNATAFARDDPAATQFTNSGILGWCPVAFGHTDANGDYTWQFDGQRTCITNGVAGGLYPLGRWEVRARPALDPQRVSPVKTLFVDPTGGVLVTTLAGLA